MMRAGDKAASYRFLTEAIGRLGGRPWQLIVVGDGEARAAIEARLEEAAPNRVRFTGVLPEDALPAIYAAGDLLVWPAVNEAFGMAILEAQATGLPVVAGTSPGVASIVADGITGRLVDARAPEQFADAISGLLDDTNERAAMGAAARDKTVNRHSIGIAAATLDRTLAALVERAG
jgi:glycosyltransferase involved in cell wall biosynthesis